MSTEIKAWKCDICGNLYFTKEDADKCESKEIVKIPNINFREQVTFQSEYLEGSKLKLRTETAIAIGKYVLCTSTGVHMECIVVRNQIQGYDRLIVQGYDGKLYSPVNTVFKLGYYDRQ